MAEEEAVAEAVAELTEDDDIARWRNRLVNMWALAHVSQSSLGNKGFFFDWITRQAGAKKFTNPPPRVRPAALAMPSAGVDHFMAVVAAAG